MYDILDFDANFAAYSEKWMQMNKDKFHNFEEMEDAMPEVYLRWLNSPAAFLMGETPAEYFGKHDNPDELIGWVREYENAKVAVPDLLLERISDLGKKSVNPLIRTAGDLEESNELRITAMNLLKEVDAGDASADICMDIIDRREEEDELADVAAELLETCAGNHLNEMLVRLDDVNDAAQETYLDLLSAYPGNEKVFLKLKEAFVSHSDKRALYASYLGKLGDERALPVLRKALDFADINYLDYLEICNSIEMLGENVDRKREFSGDPYYEALKGNNN